MTVIKLFPDDNEPPELSFAEHRAAHAASIERAHNTICDAITNAMHDDVVCLDYEDIIPLIDHVVADVKEAFSRADKRLRARIEHYARTGRFPEDNPEGAA